jgi:hypothetical protein
MKSLADAPFSVLDLAPIRRGGTAAESFHNTLDLALLPADRRVILEKLARTAGLDDLGRPASRGPWTPSGRRSRRKSCP